MKRSTGAMIPRMIVAGTACILASGDSIAQQPTAPKESSTKLNAADVSGHHTIKFRDVSRLPVAGDRARVTVVRTLTIKP